MNLLYAIVLCLLLAACNPAIQEEKVVYTNDSIARESLVAGLPADSSMSGNGTYDIILLKEIDGHAASTQSPDAPGMINTKLCAILPEPLKALLAFYSAMGGTSCSEDSCLLTTALGLGKQGSEKHKYLIRKYFPGDKVAETVLRQDCYQRPGGASSFSEYINLSIRIKGDSVHVNYRLLNIGGLEAEEFKGPDLYLFKDRVFKKLKRNIWKHSDV